MQVKTDQVEFEWDEGNLNKNRRKHKVTPEEAESVFVDNDSLVVPDMSHSSIEKRFILVGKSSKYRNLFVSFTLRKDKVRIISARRMHRKEVEKYDKIKKNTKI